MLMAPVFDAAAWSPAVMTITGSAEIDYDFDGSDLTIPFTVNGTPAAVWLVINTKGQADNIVNVRNGNLGWHYVNKIDTTAYVSQRYQRDVGETNIVWDGNDQYGNLMAAGNYDYYLWAYDDQTPRELACNFIMIGHSWDSQYTHIYENGEDGLPLAKPLIIGNNAWWYSVDAVPWLVSGIHYKWEIGSFPTDPYFLQTTSCARYPTWESNLTESYGGPVFDPNDYNTFYHAGVKFGDTTTSTFLKWEFVAGGEAIVDETWLGWDRLTLEETGSVIGADSQRQACYTDGNYIYSVSPGQNQVEEEWNKLRVVSFEGELIVDKMMHDWYMPDDQNPVDPDDPDAKNLINASFNKMYSRTPYNWMLINHKSCLHQMIDTTRLVADPNDETDMVIFENSNGDFWMDTAYDPDVEPQWYCIGDDTTSMRRESISIDRNGFNIIGVSYLGLISFGVSTQDGTGIDYMSFADDTYDADLIPKGGGLVCDSESAYDGLYFNGAITDAIGWWVMPGMSQVYFIASDSFHGVLSNAPVIEPGVEEDQAAFAVYQNAPNPFNPTTSIGFVLPSAGHVSVEIYNVAGQKIDTLTNDFLSAGKHSVVWDASGYSNGVYFYTVKSGDFSKTMKMTLIK